MSGKGSQPNGKISLKGGIWEPFPSTRSSLDQLRSEYAPCFTRRLQTAAGSRETSDVDRRDCTQILVSAPFKGGRSYLFSSLETVSELGDGTES